MEPRRSEVPTMSAEEVPVKTAYESPHLFVHGTIQDLTGRCGGAPDDGFGGSEPIINVC